MPLLVKRIGPPAVVVLENVPRLLTLDNGAAANSLFGNAVCVDVTREIFKSLFFQEGASMYPMYPALLRQPTEQGGPHLY